MIYQVNPWYKYFLMSVIRNSNPWKLSTIILSILLISCISWYFVKGNQESAREIAAPANEELVIPEHVTENAQAYADLVPPQEEQNELKEPIRKVSTIDRGDSFYNILLSYGISHSQAFEIVKGVKRVFDLSRVLPGHELALIFSPDNENLVGIEYEISGDDQLVVTIDADKIDARKEHAGAVVDEGAKPPVVSYSGELRQTDYTIRKGDNIFTILNSCGISHGQIDQAIKTVRKTYNLSCLMPGRALSVWVTEGQPVSLVRLSYEIDDLNTLEVECRNGAFTATRKTEELDVRYERAEGSITSSLYESAVQAGVSPEVVMGLTDIFAWDINFFSDIREGDTYTILYERYYVNDVVKGYGRVMAARFVNQGKEHVAVYFQNGKDIDGYFDEKGKAIRKLFLKAPLNYRRISSRFTHKRKHPIFHVVRPHLGVDYAAPTGTPIVSLGQGSVIFKGRSKGFGNCLQIKHPSGYVTYYGHLSRFAKGIHKGARVDQGEVIAYVGSTGYSTGPHLDFRVRHNGEFVNPLTLKSVNGPALREKNLARFKDLSAKRLAMLDDTSLNYTSKLTKRD